MARAFTLVELLIVIALASVLFALGIMFSLDVYRGTLFRSGRDTLVSTLATARSRALDNLYQSAHGVCYAAPDFIIFRGTSYTAGAATNETISGSPSLTLSSASNFFTCGTGTGVVFSQLSGTTTNTGAITVSDPGHPSAAVTVNTEGTIVW